ncbi:MAG TPA: hypothetical protein VJT11_01745 [Nitrospiraceae bacterium]|nr:hypothetical protein [Nitrospiraceae bacterium]
MNEGFAGRMDRCIDGREGSVNTNMMIFVATMFLVPLGLVTLYLYVSGAFTKHA